MVTATVKADQTTSPGPKA